MTIMQNPSQGQSYERLKEILLAKNSRLILLSRDIAGHLYSLSTNIGEILGLEADVFLNEKIQLLEVIAEEERDFLLNAHVKVGDENDFRLQGQWLREEVLKVEDVGGLTIVTAAWHVVNTEKQAQNDLHDRDQFFMKIIKGMPELLLIINLDQDKIVEASSLLIKQLGHKRSAVVGKSAKTLIGPFKNENHYVNLKRQLLEEGQILHQREDMVDKSGKDLAEEGLVSATAIELNGQTVGLFSFVPTAATVENAGIATAGLRPQWANWEWDIFTNEMKWERGVRKILGINDSINPSFDNLLKYVHPEDKNILASLSEKLMSDLKQFSFRYRIVRSDGSERLLYTQMEVQYEQGAPRRVLGLLQDVTGE